MKKQKVEAVTSLEGLEVGKVYKTTNYAMLKPVKGNRGSETGEVKQKVNDYVKLIEAGLFFEDTAPIIINLLAWIFDGVHRFKAFQKCAQPVHFYITANEKLNNVSKSVYLDAIALFNGTNSTWKGKDHFKSALMSKAPLAIAIDKVRSKMIADYNIEGRDITPAQIYALIAQTKTRGKKSRADYKNKKLAKVVKTDEFKSDLKFAARILEYFKTTSIRPSDILNQLLPLVWEQKVDKDRFYHNLRKYNFSIGMVNAKSIKEKVLELANKRMFRNTELTSWNF